MKQTTLTENHEHLIAIKKNRMFEISPFQGIAHVSKLLDVCGVNNLKI
jgi:hypothetical protein